MMEQNGHVTLVHPSVMMHRPTILELGGYDVDFGPVADSELWSRVADHHVVMSLPQPLVYYRIHAESMSTKHYFEQKLMLRWLQVRQLARRQGLPQPTLQEFGKLQGSQSGLHRLSNLREDWGEYLRGYSRLAWWRGHRLRALLIRAAALILLPPQLTWLRGGKKVTN